MTFTFKVKLAYKFVDYLFYTFKLTHLDFPFTLNLFIHHMNISDEFETNDLDLDLQDQTGLETSKCLCKSL